VVQRYINFSKTERVEQFERATRNIANISPASARSDSQEQALALLDQLRSAAPPGREHAWAAFLEGLRGLFMEESDV